jgi:aldehyde:ferredoxin oxidoreductase
MTTYDPRLYITTGLLYATEPRKPLQQIHEVGQTAQRWVEWVKKEEGAYFPTEAFRTVARKFWGSETAVDFSTYEGKALAAKKIQDREYVKESLILCDFSWPILWVKYSEDHVGDPSLESKVFSAVTGREVSEEELYKVGERIFNLQRAILAREGRRGRESDQLLEVFYTTPLKADFHNRECLVPGKEGEIISKRGAVVDRAEFERMKDEYYRLRGWDVESGLQTKAKLEELDLGDIAEELEAKQLLT